MTNAYYWFNSKNGPRQGAIVRKDGSLVHLDYTNYSDTAKVRDTTDAVATVNLIPRSGKWGGEAKVPLTGGNVWVNDYPTAEEAAAALLAKIRTATETEEALRADPEAYLARELKSHDWYAAYSDSPGVCGAADRHWDLIAALMKKVGPEKARDLLNQYAPEGVTFSA